MRANIPIDGLSSQELLADWEWLLRKPYALVAMNCFGDMFLTDERGQVHLLTIGFGDVTKVAESTSELEQLILDKENRSRWFYLDLLTQLEQAGMKLSPGECFGVKVPPVLGGAMEISNFAVGSITVHVSLMGQIHQQVKKLRPGTKITGVTIG